MEWTWHRACKVVERKGGEETQASLAMAPTRPTVQRTQTSPDLSSLRVKGQALCRKCGVSRCELHKHLAGWMGEGFEYCTVRERFGPVAPEGARSACYMSNPNNVSRCGRHRERR